MDRFHIIKEKGIALGWKAPLSADEDMKKKKKVFRHIRMKYTESMVTEHKKISENL